ncbi:hypothetical protein ABEB36_009722 [Hypothenemus hampei]|uniref:HMG box domain-containing protein n=1 Tax=Hypothenemus hampei TaxID=57062 RepID=A0ABD1EHA4_HYPHA
MACLIVSKACNIISNSSKLLFANKIVQVNVGLPTAGLKKDAKAHLDSLNIPPKPKKPLSAFFRYLNEHRVSTTKANPSFPLCEVVKAISEKWKQLDQETRDKYATEAAMEQEKYNEQIVRYLAVLTPEQRKALKEFDTVKRESKKKRKIKKDSKLEGRPKRPLSSFGLYVQDMHVKLGKTVSELLAEMKIKWTSLPDADKQKYQDIYLQNKEQFEKDLAQWESKMIEKGKTDLVRAKTLKGTSERNKTSNKSKIQSTTEKTEDAE